MLSEFKNWYVDRMAEMLPGVGGTQASLGPADALVIDLRAMPPASSLAGHEPGRSAAEANVPSLSLRLRTGWKEKALGAFVMDYAGYARARAALGGRGFPEVLLVLPRGSLLERVVTLPLAAEIGLASVLGYEMDRYTPFAADEVYWTAAVISRDREQERLRARIVLMPRATLSPVLEALGGLGVAPTMVESAALDGVARHLPLRTEDRTNGRAMRRWLVAAGMSCLLLGAAAAAAPFLRQSWQADAVAARIAALRPAVAQADAMRKQLLAQAAGSDVIAAEQLRLGEPLQAVAALTQLIPDDTFLTVLTLHERQLGIDGQSSSAARLIGLLSADPVIRNAAFAAPVTRAEDGSDMFSLKAEVRS